MTEDLDRALSRHTDYGPDGLDESDLAADPIEQFSAWLAEADERGVYEPNAMVLTTVDPDGAPSVRTVLLRGVDARGFEFYTDSTSRKGRALLAEPRVALVFPWYSLHRQVHVEGVAEQVEQAASDDYFSGRPRGSQIAAWSSDQSRPIASRAELERKVNDTEQRFADVESVPRPERWGGFRVRAHRIEFWAGRTSRLHDRLVYTRGGGDDDGGDDDGWRIERLQP